MSTPRRQAERSGLPTCHRAGDYPRQGAPREIIRAAMDMDFEIRQIGESDIAGFRAALNSVVSERKYLLTLTPLSLEDVDGFVRTNIENDHAQYVAELRGEIVGWADIIPERKEALAHVGKLGLGVVLEHRNRGIGKALLKRVIDHAWRSGLKRLELEVFAHNLGAIALYERAGFEHEGTKRNARLIDGRFEDVLIMAQCRV